MINSTLCPLCADGIGHIVDDNHAERIRELLDLAKDYLSHLRDHGGGAVIKGRLRQAIAKAEGK